jgi:hypothetical protein
MFGDACSGRSSNVTCTGFNEQGDHCISLDRKSTLISYEYQLQEKSMQQRLKAESILFC